MSRNYVKKECPKFVSILHTMLEVIFISNVGFFRVFELECRWNLFLHYKHIFIDREDPTEILQPFEY
jgi:hypothetical protein